MASASTEQYLRASLKAALDASDAATVGALVGAVYAHDITGEIQAELCDWWQREGRGLLAVEARLKERAGVEITAEWELDETRAKAWLRRRVDGEPGFAAVHTDDLDVLVELCRAIDVARATAEWRRRNVDELPLPVLITGETGTGKELLARAMHMVQVRCMAGRMPAPGDVDAFAPLNCAGLPKELIESELFGYEPNAFSGADRKGRDGLIEQHARGTVFLDEIGDAPPDVQVKLLRVLNDGEIRRVGAHTAKRVVPWLMAATHRDLAAGVHKGTFREDLHNRVAGHVFRLKPLRQRGDDSLGALRARIRHHAKEAELAIELAPSAEAAVRAFPWPGNLRQIDMLARRLVLTRTPGVRGMRLLLEDLPGEVQRHFVETSRNMDLARARYADFRQELAPEQLAVIRTELVRAFEEALQDGELLEARAIHVVQRLVRSSVVARLAGERHEAVVAAFDHLAARSRAALVAELQAELGKIDGVDIATVEPAPPVSSERRGAPMWLEKAMPALEVLLTSAGAAELAGEIRQLLHALPEPVQRLGEQVLMAALEADGPSSGASAANPAPATASSTPPPFLEWEKIRANKEALASAIHDAGGAASLSRRLEINERTVRRVARDHGIDVRTLSGHQQPADPDKVSRKRAARPAGESKSLK